MTVADATHAALVADRLERLWDALDTAHSYSRDPFCRNWVLTPTRLVRVDENGTRTTIRVEVEGE